MTIGERILSERNKKVMTQYALSQKADIDPRTLRNIEQGQSQGGNINSIIKICDALEIGLDDLTERREYVKSADSPQLAPKNESERMKLQGLALGNQAREITRLKEVIARQAWRLTQLEGHLSTFCRAFEEEAEQLNCCVADFKNWCEQARGEVTDNDRPLKRASASDIS